MDENFNVLGQSTDLMMDVEADHDVDVDPESLDIVIWMKILMYWVNPLI